jgi:MinD superfamily P-loop ATPase
MSMSQPPVSPPAPTGFSLSQAPKAQGREVLALALGNVNTHFVEAMTHHLPTEYLTNWDAKVVANTTDTLHQALVAEGDQWTTLLVTTSLQGSLPLATVLVHAKRRYSALRCVLLAMPDAEKISQVVATLAAYRIYNILVKDEFDYPDIVEYVTQDMPWDRIEPLLKPEIAPEVIPAENAPVPLTVTAPPLLDRNAAEPKILAAQTIAVVSGKGSVGKTGFVANCLVASAHWGTIGLDVDYIKPTLPIYFREPSTPLRTDMRQLINAIETNHRTEGEQSIGTLTPRDIQDVRAFVEDSEVLTGGFKIIPGASRMMTTMPVLPPGLTTQLIKMAKEHARLTFIDTPGVPTDDVWVEAVQAADFIVVITTPEYAAVLETVDLVRKLELLQIPKDKIWLVLNKRGKFGYSTNEITEHHLRDLHLLTTIPYEPEKWEQALLRHRPLAEKDGKFWRQVVQRMTGLEPDRPAKHWGLPRFRRR